MKNEEWKPVVGYDGLYEVSSAGNVRRKRKTNSGECDSLLSAVTDNKGYKRVCLCRNGKSQKIYVHRLVAAAFVNGFGKDVNHINGNKSDNNADNLEWCSHKANMEHAAATGLINCKPIIQMFNGKVVGLFPSLSEVNRKMGYNKSNVSKCCQGKRKTAYGYEWCWIEMITGGGTA